MLNESSSSLPLQNPKRYILDPSQSWLPTNFWNSWAAWPWKFLSNFLSLHNLLSLQQPLSTLWKASAGQSESHTVVKIWSVRWQRARGSTVGISSSSPQCHVIFLCVWSWCSSTPPHTFNKSVYLVFLFLKQFLLLTFVCLRFQKALSLFFIAVHKVCACLEVMDPHNETIENPKKSKERESDLGSKKDLKLMNVMKTIDATWLKKKERRLRNSMKLWLSEVLCDWQGQPFPRYMLRYIGTLTKD